MTQAVYPYLAVVVRRALDPAVRPSGQVQRLRDLAQRLEAQSPEEVIQFLALRWPADAAADSRLAEETWRNYRPFHIFCNTGIDGNRRICNKYWL